MKRRKTGDEGRVRTGRSYNYLDNNLTTAFMTGRWLVPHWFISFVFGRPRTVC